MDRLTLRRTDSSAGTITAPPTSRGSHAADDAGCENLAGFEGAAEGTGLHQAVLPQARREAFAATGPGRRFRHRPEERGRRRRGAGSGITIPPHRRLRRNRRAPAALVARLTRD